MTPPQALIDKLLLVHSAEGASRALRTSGYVVSIHALHTRISQLIAAGKRQPIAQADRDFHGGQTYEIPKGSSLEGSEKLLKACMNLYARKAMRDRSSLQEAMFGMLYAPAQIEAWRAAA